MPRRQQPRAHRVAGTPRRRPIAPHSAGTCSYRCGIRDRPPPSTMTSGSSRLITAASAAPGAGRGAPAWRGRRRRPVAARCDDLPRRPAPPWRCCVVARQARAADQRLDAAALAAVAGAGRVLAGIAQGSGLWPHSPARPLGPLQHAAVHRDAGAGSRCPGWRRRPRRRRRRRRRWLRTAPGSWRRWPAPPAGRARPPGRAAAAGRSGRWSCSSSSARRRPARRACRCRC